MMLLEAKQHTSFLFLFRGLIHSDISELFISWMLPECLLRVLISIKSTMIIVEDTTVSDCMKRWYNLMIYIGIDIAKLNQFTATVSSNGVIAVQIRK